jgi:serine/threonine protein kinase
MITFVFQILCAVNVSLAVSPPLGCASRKLEIIHTDLKPENVMLGLPLVTREWKLPPVDAYKHLLASAVASAEAANKQLTKNQKKRLKKKFKKRLEQGQIVHPIPILDGDGLQQSGTEAQATPAAVDAHGAAVSGAQTSGNGASAATNGAVTTSTPMQAASDSRNSGISTDTAKVPGESSTLDKVCDAFFWMLFVRTMLKGPIGCMVLPFRIHACQCQERGQGKQFLLCWLGNATR